MPERHGVYLHTIPLGKVCDGGDVAQNGFGVAATALGGSSQNVGCCLQTHFHSCSPSILFCIKHLQTVDTVDVSRLGVSAALQVSPLQLLHSLAVAICVRLSRTLALLVSRALNAT